MEAKERIIVALDVSDLGKAKWLVENLTPYVGGFKLGLEFFTDNFCQLVAGEEDEAVQRLLDLRQLFKLLDGRIFWDGKWADIPNTVGAAARAVQPVKPMFINVHASAGFEAVKSAVKNKGESKVLGVTVLTSIDGAECVSIFGRKPLEKVHRFADKLLEAGADGIICSPLELEILGSYERFNGLLKVTPGVRPEWAAVGDQKRVMPPAEAIKKGADCLVIGRPITNPPAEIGNPVKAVSLIIEEIALALMDKQVIERQRGEKND